MSGGGERVVRVGHRVRALGDLLRGVVDVGSSRGVRRVRQRDATDCGAACLASVAAHHGRPISVARVRQLAGTDRDGTTVLGLVGAATRLGLVARGVKGPPDCLPTVPLPAIAHVRAPGGLRHYVVLYRVVRGRSVVVMDPADGRAHRLSLEQFAQRWTGVLVLVAPGERLRPGAAPDSAVRRLWQLAAPQRGVLARALMGAIVYTVLGLAASVYVQKVVDHVLVDGNRNLLNLMSVAMVALLLVQAYVGAAKGMLTLRAGQSIDASLVLGYYAHLLRLPQRFFDTMRVGEITSRVSDAIKIRAFINDAVVDLLVSAVVVALSVGLVALYSPLLAALVLGAVPLYAGVYWITNRVNRRNQRALMERAAALESHVVESVTAAATVKRCGVEWFAELRAETRFVRLLRVVRASATTSLLSGAATELVSRLLTVALLWLGARLVVTRELTPGALMSCYALLGYLTAPLGRLVGANRLAQDALIAADRLFEIMDLEREDATAGVELTPELVGDVRVEALCVRYGGRPRVLHDVTFTARRGALTAIVGESGSGKSTLAAVLHRVQPIDAGRVSIGDYELGQLGVAGLRRIVGVVPQRVDLFTGTLLENIALGELEPDVRRVVDVCRSLGLGELIASLPGGLHAQIGEHGATLSGGEQQRVAIARALYRRPEILLLDEATAALDSVAEQHVQRVMRELTGAGKTVIVIAHRLSTVVAADHIVVLERGRVVEQGTHAELLPRAGAYARLWAHQLPTAAPTVAAA